MIKISSRLHGVIDYGSAAFLLVSPVLFDINGVAGMFTYLLGITHLVLTLLTDFGAGVIKVIPLKVHGLIEFVVSIALVPVSWWFKHSGNGFAGWFYLVFAAMLFMVWSLTDYKSVYNWRGK